MARRRRRNRRDCHIIFVFHTQLDMTGSRTNDGNGPDRPLTVFGSIPHHAQSSRRCGLRRRRRSHRGRCRTGTRPDQHRWILDRVPLRGPWSRRASAGVPTSRPPRLKSTGSGGGMKLFCAGLGTDHPDITNASRRMKNSELEKCRKNGVMDVVEVKIGYDGIVIANAKAAPRVATHAAPPVPRPWPSRCPKVIRKADSWSTTRTRCGRTSTPPCPTLPSRCSARRRPPARGTRFNELAIEGGCKTFPGLKAIKKEGQESLPGDLPRHSRRRCLHRGR